MNPENVNNNNLRQHQDEADSAAKNNFRIAIPTPPPAYRGDRYFSSKSKTKHPERVCQKRPLFLTQGPVPFVKEGEAEMGVVRRVAAGLPSSTDEDGALKQQENPPPFINFVPTTEDDDGDVHMPLPVDCPDPNPNHHPLQFQPPPRKIPRLLPPPFPPPPFPPPPPPPPTTTTPSNPNPEKTATSLLNELCPGLSYTFTDMRLDARSPPQFLCTVDFKGKPFLGLGRSKKAAKQAVAEAVLKVQQREGLDEVVMMNDGEEEEEESEEDFTRDDFMEDNNSSIGVVFEGGGGRFFVDAAAAAAAENEEEEKKREIKKKKLDPSNPIGSLQTVLGGGGGLLWSLESEEGPAHDKQFVVGLRVELGEECFLGRANKKSFGEGEEEDDDRVIKVKGVGRSKKRARAHAAQLALLQLLGDEEYARVFLLTPEDDSTSSTQDEPTEKPQTSTYPLTFANTISTLITAKYSSLCSDSPTSSPPLPYKVLAGIVLETPTSQEDSPNLTALSISTGTKTIDGGLLSLEGLSIQDCHAEILATRALRDFLYTELENFLAAESEEDVKECLLEQVVGEGNSRRGLWRVKEGVKFHLYISTSPCGDARIFAPNGIDAEATATTAEDASSNRKNRGLLRAKIESGEGTIPVDNLLSGPQTIDAIRQGNALYTMSCSDKLLRYNLLGVQGALLSSFILPVYFSSVTLGSLHHPVHFRRALLTRLDPFLASTCDRLPSPYGSANGSRETIPPPHLLMVPCSQEQRKVKKSPNHALVWTLGWSTPEVLAASKGRCGGDVASRLCKRMLFLRWLKIWKELNPNVSGIGGGGKVMIKEMSYRDAKLLAGEYQITKELFRQYCSQVGYGKWAAKPLEIDSFSVQLL